MFLFLERGFLAYISLSKDYHSILAATIDFDSVQLGPNLEFECPLLPINIIVYLYKKLCNKIKIPF